MVMLVNIRRGAGKSVVGQVPFPLDLKRPKYDRLKFCIATVLLPRPTPLNADTVPLGGSDVSDTKRAFPIPYAIVFGSFQGSKKRTA